MRVLDRTRYRALTNILSITITTDRDTILVNLFQLRVGEVICCLMDLRVLRYTRALYQ